MADDCLPGQLIERLLWRRLTLKSPILAVENDP